MRDTVLPAANASEKDSGAPSVMAPAPVAVSPRRSMSISLAVAVLAPLVGVSGALMTLGASGGLDAAEVVGLPDPGVLTRLGLPAVQALRDLLAMATVGFLVVAAWCVPRRGRNERSPAQDLLVLAGQLGATGWAVANAVLVVLVYSDVLGQPPGGAGATSQLFYFAFNLEAGRNLTWGAVLAVGVAVVCAVGRRPGGVGVAAALAIVALWPMALSGHAAGTLAHDHAVNLQMLHLVATAVWAGGLTGLFVVRRRLEPAALATAARHFSGLAGASLVTVAVSGVIGAALRVRRVEGLDSAYGAVLGLKVVALLVLAGLGWWQRHRLIARLEAAPRVFSRIVALEVVVLATAAGWGVAMARTAPPPPPDAARPLTTAESLTGRDLPAPLDLGAWFTGWTLDSLFGPLAVVMIVLYLAGVVRLHRRGDAWSVLRTIAWVVGWLLFLWATNGAPGTYGKVLFSMHMVQHMTIATGVPVFLVLGTPVTLALRALRRRTDGTMGPREWLLRAVHAWPLKVVGHPVVAATVFVGGIVAFYYSSAFEASLLAHTAHIVMVLHFLVSGYLFAEVVVGADPGVQRPSYPLRALLLMVTFGFHALFSVGLMASTTVFAADWFGALRPPWGRSLAADQYVGASLGWGLGEYPLGVMAVALLVSWVQADRRERRRFDRREDRSDHAELAAYNEHLHRLAATIPDERTSAPRGGPTGGRRSGPRSGGPQR